MEGRWLLGPLSSNLRFQAAASIRWQECEERTRTQHGEMEMGEAVHGWLQEDWRASSAGAHIPGDSQLSVVECWPLKGGTYSAMRIRPLAGQYP